MSSHLVLNGIDPDYNPWTLHGEEVPHDEGDRKVHEEDEDYLGDDMEDEECLLSDEIALWCMKQRIWSMNPTFRPMLGMMRMSSYWIISLRS